MAADDDKSPRLDAIGGSIARKLFADHRAGKRFETFAAASGIRSLEAAYAVQGEYVRILRKFSGSAVAGYKIGLTSRQMQKMCGIETPVAGIIVSDRVLSSPTVLHTHSFGRLGLEFEIAVRIGRDLREKTNEFTVADISAVVDAVCPAIELIDDRYCDYAKLDAFSLVADNSWNAGIVHGAFSRDWPELEDMEGIAFADGNEIGRGFGRDAMGHPFIPLTWLANHLAAGGTCLRAGDIVMTGSIIKTQFPSKSTHYRFDMGSVGHVSCRVNM